MAAWTIQEGKTLLHIETANPGDGSPCGEAICSVPKSKMEKAKLIAAAPELLEALQGFVKRAGQLNGMDTGPLALAKATE